MKKKLLSFLKKIIVWLEKLYVYSSAKEKLDLGYSSLSPTDDGDKQGHYSKAIAWAIKNREEKDIKNIALTGPYGSGKSTILKTFQKNYRGKDLYFLNISLASFKDEKKSQNENNEKLRLIEISILQQIFYHEADNKIPDSRFKKIRSHSKSMRISLTIGFLAFAIALLNYLNPYLIQSIFKDIPFSDFTCNILHYGSISIIIMGCLFLIYKSVRVISTLTIHKLKFQNVEIGTDESLNKSIFNHHLDEILYFFSVRPYNVVIIEDLDRFQETEIFVKLREINLLLNSSKKTKVKDIVFIYAVGDDMFNDNERIKFFDFIIPVIPVINYSNSNEILLAKNKEFKYELSNEFIENISFFIDDMRLLHNICNEFFLYMKQQDNTLSHDKIFAIIMYKNIYPEDFISLSKNEGDLYLVLNSKKEYIDKEINTIDIKIEKLKLEIENLEKLNIKDVTELRLLYVLRMMEALEHFHSFTLHNKVITIDELTKGTGFEFFKADKLFYNKYDDGRYSISYTNKKINILFSEIEKKVDVSKSYMDREKEIRDFENSEVSNLKFKIEGLQKRKAEIRNFKIAELLKSNIDLDLNISEKLDKDFITTLLRNGYIAEDYLYYISTFHGESMTDSDHKFVIGIHNKINQEFDYKLTQVKSVIKKIKPFDFSKEFIFNYDLVDYLLLNRTNYKQRTNYLFERLSDDSTTSMTFISEYIKRKENLNVFVNILCSEWYYIWDSYYMVSEEEKYELLYYIIEYAEIESISKIAKFSNLQYFINNNPNFLKIIVDEDKIKKVIQILDIRFEELDFENSSFKLLEYIYSKGHFVFSIEMIHSLIKKIGPSFNDDAFQEANYFLIKKAGYNEFIRIVDERINEYVQNVYLKIGTNVKEPEQYLCTLLNNTNLKLENKKQIIKQVETKIDDFIKIKDKDPELYSIFFDENKVKAKWDNLLWYFRINEDVISDSMIAFINKIENAKELSNEDIKEGNVYNYFYREVLQEEGLNKESYDLILESNSEFQNDLRLNELSEEKVNSLIEYAVIKPTYENYVLIFKSHKNLIVKLFEVYKKDYLEIVSKLELDDLDLESILKSKNISNSAKNEFLNSSNEKVIITNPENLKLLSEILLDDDSFHIKESLMNTLLKSKDVLIENRVKLFNLNFTVLEESFIIIFLKNLGTGYDKILDISKKTKIQNTQENQDLLNNLKLKAYISSFTKNIESDYLRVYHKRK